MSARHVSFPNSNSFSSAVTGPTKRLVYVSALGAAEDSFRSNGNNTTIGKGTEKLDTDDYNEYKILSTAFRVWAAVTPNLKRERLLQEEASRIRVVRGMEDLRRSALAHAFNSLVHACNNSRREREQLVIALEQWSLVLMRKVLRGWHFAALKAPAMEAQARLASDSASSLSSFSKSNRIDGAPSSPLSASSSSLRSRSAADSDWFDIGATLSIRSSERWRPRHLYHFSARAARPLCMSNRSAARTDFAL